MMTKINERLTESIPGTYNLKQIPEFHFQPLSIEGKKALREKALELWEKGVISTDTMSKSEGYSLERERKKREQEKSDGTDKIMAPRDVEASAQNEAGRNPVDDSERKSDPEAAIRGKQPKPSNPEGSMGNE